MTESERTPGRNQQVTDEELMTVLRNRDEPFATAADVAEEVAIGRRAVHNRLHGLMKEGYINARKIGNRVVWYPFQVSGFADPDTIAEVGEGAEILIEGPEFDPLVCWIYGRYGDGETFEDWPGNNSETMGLISKENDIRRFEYDPYNQTIQTEGGEEFANVVANSNVPDEAFVIPDR